MKYQEVSSDVPGTEVGERRLTEFFLEGWREVACDGIDFQWLLRLSDERFEKMSITIPFVLDHTRAFHNPRNGRRAFISQPYIPAYTNRNRGSSLSSLEEKADYDQFQNDWLSDAHKAATVERLSRIVEPFAESLRLEWEVSVEKSWHVPGKTVLIVLKEGE